MICKRILNVISNILFQSAFCSCLYNHGFNWEVFNPATPGSSPLKSKNRLALDSTKYGRCISGSEWSLATANKV